MCPNRLQGFWSQKPQSKPVYPFLQQSTFPLQLQDRPLTQNLILLSRCEDVGPLKVQMRRHLFIKPSAETRKTQSVAAFFIYLVNKICLWIFIWWENTDFTLDSHCGIYHKTHVKHKQVQMCEHEDFSFNGHKSTPCWSFCKDRKPAAPLSTRPLLSEGNLVTNKGFWHKSMVSTWDKNQRKDVNHTLCLVFTRVSLCLEVNSCLDVGKQL